MEFILKWSEFIVKIDINSWYYILQLINLAVSWITQILHNSKHSNNEYSHIAS